MKRMSIDAKAAWEAVVQAFVLDRIPSGSESVIRPRTTAEERADIFSRWLAGDNDCYISLAIERNLLPIALITAAIVDSEHPVLFPNGILPTRSFVGMYAVILQVELRREAIGQATAELTLQLANEIMSNPEITKL